jgi:hypothetical protein
VASASGGESGLGRHDEVVQFGSGRSSGGRWLSRLVLACLAVGAVIAIVLHSGAQPHPARKAVPPAPPPPLLVTVVGHRLLGVTAGWELYARGPDDLVRIQPAQGRISQTYVPALESGTPEVEFVIGDHEAIIRSSDEVPGYMVPDGGQARLLGGRLAGSGPLIPGPSPNQAAWVTAGVPTSPVLSLVSLTGRRTGPVIHFPAMPTTQMLPATAVPDGRGYVLVMTSSSGVYDAGPGWDRAIPGLVAAVGPVNWLVLTCNADYGRCRTEVVDSVTGARRVLPGPALPDEFFSAWPPPGVISPDGMTAAVPEPGRGGRTTVHLINLRTGANRDVGVSLGKVGAGGVPAALDSSYQSMVWSPDGHWLFVAATGGRLVAVNAQSGAVQGLGVALPAVTQVAILAQPAADS